MNTPKAKDKSIYTSPIKLLKHANNTQNVYEDEFYRIKAQRLETEVQELRMDNGSLKNKLAEARDLVQTLKEKIYVLESQAKATSRFVPSFGYDSRVQNEDKSKSPSKQSKLVLTSFSTANAEIERLSKQIRVLKNDHEMQLSSLRDQNKKLQRRITEAQSLYNSKRVSENTGIKTIPQEQSNVKTQKITQIQAQNSKLRQSYDQCLSDLKQYQEQAKEYKQKNLQLSKSNKQLKLLLVTEERNSDLLKKAQAENVELEQRIRQLSKSFQQSEKKYELFVSEATSDEKFSPEIKRLKNKVQMLQQKLKEKQQQNQDVLLKLRPLLKKDRSPLGESRKQEMQPSQRASLSMLQVFLTKYKINMF